MRRFVALLIAGLLGASVARALPALADAGPQRVYLPLVADGTIDASGFPTLAEFIAEVSDGQADVIRGVYVPEVLALPVEQQPGGDPAFVSPEAGVVTQFGMASGFGVTGLLAHNYLAGARFFDLAHGQPVSVIFGDGATQTYVVNDVQRYRALQPDSPYSNFINLDTGEPLSATDLFLRVYVGVDHVTFQTCIELDGNASGGRLFVIATSIP
jgi:uncharacterized protein YbjT (DUF2867 family)